MIPGRPAFFFYEAFQIIHTFISIHLCQKVTSLGWCPAQLIPGEDEDEDEIDIDIESNHSELEIENDNRDSRSGKLSCSIIRV
jgi:hypothetical protein